MNKLIGFALFSAACGKVEGMVDETPPTIAMTRPADGAEVVPVSQTVVVEFSEAMDRDSVTLSLTPAADLAVEWADDTTVTFTPAAPLATRTAYTATVGGQDPDRNGLDGPATFSFTTGDPDDATAPTLTGSSPADQAVDVDPATPIVLTFSEPMAAGTVEVMVEPLHDLGAPTWGDSAAGVTFTPPEAFAPGATVALTILGLDEAGNALAPATVSFTTAVPPDGDAPSVVASSPSGATVPTNAVVTVVFSEPMDHAASEAAIAISPSVGCAWAWSEMTVTCTPAASFAGLMPYTVTVGTGARDAAGNALASPYAWSFTTASAPDTTAPSVASFTPGTDAAGVARTATIDVTFSEPMDRVATESAFLIGLDGATPSAAVGSYTWSGSTMSFHPATPWAYGTAVRWRVAAAATDEAGNALLAAFSRTFTVVRQGSATVTATAALDGYVRGDHTVAATVGYINVGDRPDGLAVYGYLSFDSSMVPAGATITSAVVNVYQQSVTNGPYGSGALGALRVERVEYGASLGGSDFDLAADPTTSLILSNNATVEPKSVDVASIVAACAGAASCQLRVRFARDTESPAGDGEYDYVTLGAAESTTTTQRPTLRLTWEYP